MSWEKSRRGYLSASISDNASPIFIMQFKMHDGNNNDWEQIIKYHNKRKWLSLSNIWIMQNVLYRAKLVLFIL